MRFEAIVIYEGGGQWQIPNIHADSYETVRDTLLCEQHPRPVKQVIVREVA